MPPGHFMQRALDLARNAPAPTSPNPTVGAVVVAGGEIVGEGVTEPPPGPHAEAVALRQAGEKARGATLYSTLEPCSHTGRTPPCTEAIIAAGISRGALRHPRPRPRRHRRRPRHPRSRRYPRLRRRVRRGGERESTRRSSSTARTGLPFVIAKFAASLDGRIAAASGDSRWVSGPETRQWSHNLRTRIDAILAGSDTVIIDDPLLTARPGDQDAERQPLRVVVDSRGRTPPMARVFTGPAKTLVATARRRSDPLARIARSPGCRGRRLPGGG